MKKRFLLIAQPNSYRIAPYIKATLQMGLEVLIASRGEHSLITEVHAGLHIDLDNHEIALESILKANNQRSFVGILGSDDSTVELAAMAAAKLGLPHNPPQSARLSCRKDLARAHLTLANCPIPIHCLIDLSQPLNGQMAGLPWPCVIKPLNMSASRGVIRANNKTEFFDACERVRVIISESADELEQTHILIEQYIDGIEVAYEGYLQNGQLHTLAIFDKPDPLTGPFFEETIYVTPSSLNETMITMLHNVVQDACNAYGLITGPIHAELRIDSNNKAWVLEVASRTIGGDCARTLDDEDSMSLEELTINLAIGKDILNTKQSKNSHGVMMIPIKQAGLLKRVEGIIAARKIPYIDSIEIVIPAGHEVVPLPEGNQYLGYIFASADNYDDVINAIRQAYKTLNFVVAPVIKIHQA